MISKVTHQGTLGCNPQTLYRVQVKDTMTDFDSAECMILSIRNLTKYFPQVKAIDCISFDVKMGEIHCLLGENGAGKSTLSKCLFGIHRPDSGKIYFKGTRIDLSSPKIAIQLGIGMVHQHFALIPSMTVLENIAVGIQSEEPGFDLSRVQVKLKSLCESLSIDLDLQEQVWHLSVGEQQWVEILKALFPGVKLLILDEPTASLTPQETDKLFNTLDKMKANGLSILFITHKLKEVMQVSDRVTVLRKGKLIATLETSAVTIEQLAELMVGRAIDFRLPRDTLLAGEPVLEVQSLSAIGDRGQEAIKDISFKLHSHEILGIAGVAGNGQKELYEVLVGSRKAEHGKILLGKEDITTETTEYRINRRIRHIPGDRIQQGLVIDFNIAENLILGLQDNSTFKRGPFSNQGQIYRFADQCIAEFGIATPSHDLPTRLLSGGHLQRVILARELSQNPICLIADQPTRGLDVGAIEYVHGRLLEARKNGVAILLFSEDLDEIFNLADRIAVLFKGQIMCVLNASEADIGNIGLLMGGCGDKL